MTFCNYCKGEGGGGVKTRSENFKCKLPWKICLLMASLPRTALPPMITELGSTSSVPGIPHSSTSSKTSGWKRFLRKRHPRLILLTCWRLDGSPYDVEPWQWIQRDRHDERQEDILLKPHCSGCNPPFHIIISDPFIFLESHSWVSRFGSISLWQGCTGNSTFMIGTGYM